jgi:hypothetical protein
MEATGVYWKPVWHILADGEFELLLANAAHVKKVPGRKTDYQDLGADHSDKRHKTASTRRLVQRLHNLGFAVQLTPVPA